MTKVEFSDKLVMWTVLFRFKNMPSGQTMSSLPSKIKEYIKVAL